MADQVTYPGRLIAIDGSRGKDVNAAAAAVAVALKARGVETAISRWDASGLFGELAAAGRGDRNISPRSLSLVYAADLAFRLRWEIRPVLEAGGIVIAGPYLETAIAFGATCGLDEKWLRELLRFAPRATWDVRAEEKKIARSWKRRLDRGYGEYAATLLDASAPGCVSKSARRKMMMRLEATHHRKTFSVSKKGLESLVKACRAEAERRRITGSLRDGSSRASSRPRSGRK